MERPPRAPPPPREGDEQVPSATPPTPLRAYLSPTPFRDPAPSETGGACPSSVFPSPPGHSPSLPCGLNSSHFLPIRELTDTPALAPGEPASVSLSSSFSLLSLRRLRPRRRLTLRRSDSCVPFRLSTCGPPRAGTSWRRRLALTAVALTRSRHHSAGPRPPRRRSVAFLVALSSQRCRAEALTPDSLKLP